MQKTENVGNILTEIIRRNDLEPKMLEQKVFDLWRKRLGVPFGTKTIPVSLSDGVLKIYTEYPPYKNELVLLKQKFIAALNAELGQPILTDLRIELRSVQTAPAHDTNAPPPQSSREPSQPASTDTTRRTTPEELERIEQTLANVTDERLKRSLRQLFTTQSEDNP